MDVRAEGHRGSDHGAMGPFAVTVPAVFTVAECDRVLTVAAQRGHADAGLVGGAVQHAIRRADIFWLDDDGETAWVMERIVGTVADINRRHFHFELTDFGERLQIARYSATRGGHYDWHSDMGNGPLARRRKLTIVVQLSAADSYEGGALELNPAGRPVAASRERGDATVFASFLLHRVQPVSAGIRASLTLWVHGPAFR